MGEGQTVENDRFNKSRGKKFKVKGRHGPKRAAGLIEAGIKNFKKKK